MRRFCYPTTPAAVLTLVAASLAAAPVARAGGFDEYFLAGSFSLPGGAGVFDVLHDGRLVTLAGDQVLTETGVGSGAFAPIGSLPGADLPTFGASFLRVSPDGTRVAVGNNGGAGFDHFQVGVFDLAGLSGTWFSADHFDAAWFDDTRLALTAGPFGEPAVVTLLDTTSAVPSDPSNPIVIGNIGGASAGIAFDGDGNLYTGNGFAIAGPSGTGLIKHFDNAAWTSALAGGPAVDFENEGTEIVDLLSAASLGFDGQGNLFVGGGDFAGDLDYAAVVNASAVSDALAGMVVVDPLDPNQVLRLDPDELNDQNLYDVRFNPVTGDLYLRDGAVVYRYVVPEPATASMLLAFLCAASLRRRQRRRRGRHSAAGGVRRHV